MTDETNVQEEVPAQEEQKEIVQVESSKKDELDHNWKAANEVMRAQKQQLEMTKMELEQLKMQMQQHQQKIQQQEQDEPDEFEKLDKRELITIEQAEKLAEKKAKIATKKMLEEYSRTQEEQSRQSRIAQDEERVRSKFDDYDYVLENFALPMIKNDPALAHKIQNSKNPAETAYKLGKLSDEYEATMSKQQTSPKAEKIIKNSNRPTSSNAVTSGLKGQVEDFSKLSPSEIWSMSQKYARGA